MSSVGSLHDIVVTSAVFLIIHQKRVIIISCIITSSMKLASSKDQKDSKLVACLVLIVPKLLIQCYAWIVMCGLHVAL